MKIILTLLTLFATQQAFSQDVAGNFFSSDKVHRIDVSIDNWDQLRNADPVGGRCVFGFIGDQYEWFSASSVSIDGQSFQNVGVKKKSWCGSESKSKPSLNVSLDRFEKKQEDAAKKLLGGAALTLNNSVQDPSYIRQCFAYSFFRDLGLPAPYCSFAVLTVNGQEQGLYVLMEAMKKPFLKRTFGPQIGNVYEIAGEGFEDWALARLAASMDNNTGDGSLSDIKRVIDAVRDNSGSFEAIQQSVALDKFYRYWSAEVLLMHWDGLTLGSNNSYLYFDTQGQMQVIPWGTDQILLQSGPKEANQIYNSSRLTQKILANEAGKAQFYTTFRSILGNEWNEDALKAKASTLASTIRPYLNDSEKGSLDWHLDLIGQNISSRRATLQTLLGEANVSGYPFCASSESDPDGDSWGWENEASCIVRK
ncbi:MAG: CotH kinase family protein [Bdellovibrionota bacterium]